MVKGKGKRIKIHDQITEIPASEMLSAMKDTSNITGRVQKGPKTREDVELLETSGLERYFAFPTRHYGCTTLKDIVKRNLYLYSEVTSHEEEEEEAKQFKLKLEDLVEDDAINPNVKLAELRDQLKSNIEATLPVETTPTYVAKSFKGITPRVQLKPRMKVKKVSLPTEASKSEDVYEFEEEEEEGKAELLNALHLQASPEKRAAEDRAESSLELLADSAIKQESLSKHRKQQAE